ncbi:MAG TPA: hypothetical protein VGI32_06450 [Steroidobacteraceae bacterium]
MRASLAGFNHDLGTQLLEQYEVGKKSRHSNESWPRIKIAVAGDYGREAAAAFVSLQR